MTSAVTAAVRERRRANPATSETCAPSSTARRIARKAPMLQSLYTGQVRNSLALPGALAVGTLVAICSNVPLAHGDAKPATISVDEIKDGMKGYGLTVFKGTDPERFDVEVIGVLHHFRPGQELIVIRTPNPRLDVVKTVRGMSGSPIYLDGRLAGAYAYSLSQFEVEPVAGVTPIDLMLAEMRRPIPPGFWPLEGKPPLPGATRPAPTPIQRPH